MPTTPSMVISASASQYLRGTFLHAGACRLQSVMCDDNGIVFEANNAHSILQTLQHQHDHSITVTAVVAVSF